MPNRWEQGVIQYIILILLALGLGAGLYLSQKGAIFKSKAGNESTRIQVVNNNENPIDTVNSSSVKLKIVYVPKVIPTTSPIASILPSPSSTPVTREFCQPYDGDLVSCNKHKPYCAYYSCSESCWPDGTDLSIACQPINKTECAGQKDLVSCNNLNCAWYSCSESCWPKGTSLQAAGCVEGVETSIYPKYFRVANCSTEQLDEACINNLQKDKNLEERTDWRGWNGGYQRIDNWQLTEGSGKKYIFAQFSRDGVEWEETISTTVSVTLPTGGSSQPSSTPQANLSLPTPSATATLTPQPVSTSIPTTTPTPQATLTDLSTPAPITEEFKDTCQSNDDCAPGTACKTVTEGNQTHLACVLSLK